MTINDSVLQNSEKIILTLRQLYLSCGYQPYHMSKFEEYDLYAQNKDFLVSDGVITFTDTNGKLMALKPDVTLSIVKNTKDSADSVQKLYYNENVYRVSKGTHTFKEIMQVGLECIGNVDDYCIYEVLTLALKSLKSISESCVLDISHIGLLLQAVDYAGIPENEKADIFRCIGEKNLHELAAKCSELGVSDKNAELLKELASMHGSPAEILPRVNSLLENIADEKTLSQFNGIVSSLSSFGQAVNIDFSLVDSIRYYNGFMFKGFVEGVPNSVLSGGQYDTLMKKMKRKTGAVGFAVYLDMLEQLNRTNDEYDVDTVLVYGNDVPFEEVEAQAENLRGEGSVLVLSSVPENIRYKKLVEFLNGEVKTVENNA